jgi:hypothetical protein
MASGCSPSYFTLRLGLGSKLLMAEKATPHWFKVEIV